MKAVQFAKMVGHAHMVVAMGSGVADCIIRSRISARVLSPRYHLPLIIPPTPSSSIALLILCTIYHQ